MTNNLTFGKKLRALRILRGFTQVQLAKKVGIPQFRISDLEVDRNLPTPELTRDIELALDRPGWLTDPDIHTVISVLTNDHATVSTVTKALAILEAPNE